MLKVIVPRNPLQAKVLDAKTGEDVGVLVPITEIDVKIKAECLTTAKILLDFIEAEVDEGEVKYLIRKPGRDNPPAPVARIVWADGSEMVFAPGERPRFIPYNPVAV